MAERSPYAMRWPTLRHKLWPVSAYCWPAYNGFWFESCDWYTGPWLRVSLGWWAVQLGSGSYA